MGDAANKAARKVTEESLHQLGIPAQEQSKNVFRIEFGDRQTAMYYPTSGKWQYRGKTHRGSPEELGQWFQRARAA